MADYIQYGTHQASASTSEPPSPPALEKVNAASKSGPPALEKVGKDKPAIPALEKVAKAKPALPALEKVERDQVVSKDELDTLRKYHIQRKEAGIEAGPRRFKVISKIVPEHWQNDWIHEMDDVVGKIGTLTRTDMVNGYALKFDEGSEYWFPGDAIEEVTAVKSITVSFPEGSPDPSRAPKLKRKVIVPSVSYLLYRVDEEDNITFVGSIPNRESMLETCVADFKHVMKDILDNRGLVVSGNIIDLFGSLPDGLEVSDVCRANFNVVETGALPVCAVEDSENIPESWREDFRDKTRHDRDHRSCTWFLIVAGLGVQSRINFESILYHLSNI